MGVEMQNLCRKEGEEGQGEEETAREAPEEVKGLGRGDADFVQDRTPLAEKGIEGVVWFHDCFDLPHGREAKERSLESGGGRSKERCKKDRIGETGTFVDRL